MMVTASVSMVVLDVAMCCCLATAVTFGFVVSVAMIGGSCLTQVRLILNCSAV